MNTYITEPLRYSEIDKVSSLLADAFITNPAYSAIFKNKERLEEGLLWLFKANLLIHNQQQTLTMVIKECETKEIIGTFTLIPPQGIKKSISIYTKVGIGRFISRFGLNTLIRMLRLDSLNKKQLSDSLKNSEHYYLSMVAIKEEYRGKGVGSLVLRNTITELANNQFECHLLALTTQLLENVTFYSRLGFDKLDEGYVVFKEIKYYNYNMKLDLSQLKTDLL